MEQSMTARRRVLNIILYIVLVLGALIIAIPFVWMLSSSLKLSKDVFSYPIRWIPQHFEWGNYVEIWQKIPLITFFLNTVKLTVIITLIQLITSSFAAYSFARLQFPGRNLLFLAYIATIAIPWQVYMVPQYIMIARIGLTDTHLAIILMQSFTAVGVFMMRQFFMGIPFELSEAARIDGLSEYGIYWRIIMPLAKPALATLTITTFVFVWNDFMGPLIYLSSTNKKTLQLGLRMFISQYSADYNLVMAASMVSMIPIFIMYGSLQKFFVEGIATAGLKG